MKMYGGVDVLIHIFLTSTLVGGKWSALRPGRFTPGKDPTVPNGYEAGWTSESIWMTLEEYILNPPYIRTPVPWSSGPYPVTIRLRYPGSYSGGSTVLKGSFTIRIKIKNLKYSSRKFLLNGHNLCRVVVAIAFKLSTVCPAVLYVVVSWSLGLGVEKVEIYCYVVWFLVGEVIHLVSV
jgi:hypothetical protein